MNIFDTKMSAGRLAFGGVLVVIAIAINSRAEGGSDFKSRLDRCVKFCEQLGEAKNIGGGCYHMCPAGLEYYEKKVLQGSAPVAPSKGEPPKAQPTQYPKAKVSFDDFKSLVAEVEPHRAKRLVNLDAFLKMSKEDGVIILDTRSDFRFERMHVKGAKHLSFTDFTQANLSKVIPSFDTKVLIYCNNNFDGDQTDFASKMVELPQSSMMALQVAAQAKPIMMALNVPTYINLYGYGYRNVYELDELVDVKDPRIEFEGTVAPQH